MRKQAHRQAYMADGALGFCLAQLNSDRKDGPKSLV